MVPLRVFNSTGEGTLAYVADAVNYAINHNISILNYSGGSNGNDSNLYDVINNYNGIFIVSAGNGSLVDKEYVGDNTDNKPYYPAVYDCDNIIAVASTDSNDNKATSSNYGRTTIDLGAPGVSINSTTINNSYGYKSGTSMAAPQVTGTVALLKSYFPGATTEQLKWAIMQGVDSISSLSGITVTGGRLNAYNSFLKLMDYQFVQERVVAGDFNGDGKDDIAGLYYYNLDSTKIKVWLSNGSGLNEPENWYETASQNYNANNVNGRIIAGDFNGDGKGDITTMYNYGNNRVAYHMGISTGNSFNGLNSWFDSGNGSYSADRVGSRMISGDFNGDGKDDVATMYDYGQLVISIHTWKSSGNTLLGMEEWYRSGVDGT